MKYKVSDLAKLLGVTTNTIRRYEKENFLKSERDNSNYRWYNEFDISKTAMIRIYTKCGFSHEEIKNMLNSDNDSIICSCENKIVEIEELIQRMKLLKNWLNDNVKMMKNIKDMENSYKIIDKLDLKCVFYAKGLKLFEERERLNIIKHFMYTFPKVQLIQLFEKEDVVNSRISPYTGWAVRTSDFKNFFEENEYIKSYTIKKSICGILKTPLDKENDLDYYKQIRKKYFNDILDYINKNGYSIDGNIIEIIVDAFGNIKTSLIYTPITM